MSLRFAARTRPATMVSTWLNSLVSGTVVSYAGYVAGGESSVHDTVDKFDFADDSRTTLGTGLSNSLEGAGGFANSGTAGYVAGGYTVTTVDKFAFSDDSRSTLGTGLSTAVSILASFANSGTAGYTAGGDSGSSTSVATVNKFAFSDDGRTTLGTGLSAASRGVAGFANSGTAGYTLGGRLTGYGAVVDTVDKFAFSDDGRTTLGTGLSTDTYGLVGFANSGTAGYSAGGSNGSWAIVATVDKFAFSDDGRTTLGTGLSGNRRFPTSFANAEAL